MAAPTINSVACQEQVIEAAKLVAKNVEGVVQTGQVSQSFLLSRSYKNKNSVIKKFWVWNGREIWIELAQKGL